MHKPVDKDALSSVQVHYDFLPPSQVAQVVERYLFECWRLEVGKNPRVLRLARMAVGSSIFWFHASERKDGRTYLQTADAARARAVMREPKARWRVVVRDGMPVVTRIA